LSNSNDNAAALKTWLTRHKMTELEFMTCVKGEAKNRPYFPFHLPHQTFPAKVLALETGEIFFTILVESFYSIKYRSSIVTSNVCQIILVMKTKTLVFPEK
jgi:hypothetical protein